MTTGPACAVSGNWRDKLMWSWVGSVYRCSQDGEAWLVLHGEGLPKAEGRRRGRVVFTPARSMKSTADPSCVCLRFQN